MTLKELSRNFKKVTNYGDERGSGAAYRLYNEALEFIGEQNYKEARQCLKSAVKIYPAFDDAYMLLGLTHFACGSRIDALKTINQISDPHKHNTAMKYYDAISGGNDAPPAFRGEKEQSGKRPGDVPGQAGEGVFAVPDMEHKAAAAEGTLYGETSVSDEEYVGDGQTDRYPGENGEGEEEPPRGENSGGNDTPEEELIIFDQGPAGKGSARMTDFERRFKKARESVREALGHEGREPSGNGENVRRSSELPSGNDPGADHESKSRSPERGGTDTDERTAENDSEQSAGKVPGGSGRARAQAQAGGSAEASDEPDKAPRAEPPAEQEAGPSAGRAAKSGGSRKLLMALVIAACILVLAGLGALAASRHLAYVNKNSGVVSDPSTPPSGTPETAAPYETPQLTEGPTENATPEPDTPEPTAETTPGPTEALSETVAAARKYYDEKNYYDCFVLLSDADLTGLSPAEASEVSQMKNDSLALFSKEYYNLMYSYVGKEDWENVLKYALPIIQYNPDYENGGAVYFHAGKACELTGDADNARKYYQDTMSKYPGTPYEEYARYRLSLM
ncbi:MAG: hypothetical protein IKX06_01695 [Clostridia bacterium]|nr:hypothetical protein [Clostridia bacterium]